jgi:hypothetical protein
MAMNLADLIDASRRLSLKDRRALVDALRGELEEGNGDIAELEGLGEEVWRDIDVDDYVRQERDAWTRSTG